MALVYQFGKFAYRAECKAFQRWSPEHGLAVFARKPSLLKESFSIGRWPELCRLSHSVEVHTRWYRILHQGWRNSIWKGDFANLGYILLL